MHFLGLRDHSHAQYEVREYAKQVAEAVKAHTPVAYEAFETYRKNGMNLSEKELRVLKRLVIENLLSPDIDFENLDFYTGAGFVIKDKSDPTKEKMMLGREGLDFRKKLERLLRE